MIVDDNAGNRTAFSSVLEPLGYTIVQAESGSGALEEARKASFAVILLDVRMPDMNGLQVAALLRGRDRSRFTPIIFVSAYQATPAMVADARLVGAVDYLFSPVDADLLRLKVSAFAELYLYQERVFTQNLDLRTRIQKLERENGELRGRASVPSA